MKGEEDVQMFAPTGGFLGDWVGKYKICEFARGAVVNKMHIAHHCSLKYCFSGLHAEKEKKKRTKERKK